MFKKFEDVCKGPTLTAENQREEWMGKQAVKPLPPVKKVVFGKRIAK